MFETFNIYFTKLLNKIKTKQCKERNKRMTLVYTTMYNNVFPKGSNKQNTHFTKNDNRD